MQLLPTSAPVRRFLFLQGPTSPFFRDLAAALRAYGHATRRINLCLGDRLFWDGSGATDYRGRPRDWPGFIAGYLERESITDVVLLGEQRPYHKAAITAARARGIDVTVTDYGYLRPDWIVLERDGMGAESRFPRDPATIMAIGRECPAPDLRHLYGDDFALQARWDVLHHMASLLPLPFPHYESYLLHHPVPAYLGTGMRLLRRKRDTARAAQALAELQPRGPLWLFAMQMENDYSIRAYSQFQNNDQALGLVLDSFARNAPADGRLMVKVHPLDPGLKRWDARLARLAAEAGVAGRVHLLDGALSADPAILASRGVVTINSTLGVQAITLGRPVMALGRAIYQVPGLSWLGSLDAFWESAPPPDADLADAFLRGIAACLHVRGRFYGRPGLDVAVAGAARRLHLGLVNQPLVEVMA